VEDVKVRNNHCRARLCTPEGEHIEVVLSKGKNKEYVFLYDYLIMTVFSGLKNIFYLSPFFLNSGCYQALKYSMWGDLFPVILTKYEDDELSAKERFRLKMMEQRKTEGGDTGTERDENMGEESTVEHKVEELKGSEEEKEIVKEKELSGA